MSGKVDAQIFSETFNYDAKTDCLIHKRKSSFKFPFSELTDRGTHYEADLNPRFEREGMYNRYEGVFTFCRVGQRVDLDPDGMAEKYGLSISELKGKTDFDVMVNQDYYNLRVTQALWPSIEIAGEPFWCYVKHRVISAQDIEVRSTIDFAEMRKEHGFTVYENNSNCYYFPYDLTTKTISDVDFSSLKNLPQNIVIVQVPDERSIDPVGLARLQGLNVKAFLKLNPIRDMEFKAKVIPWSKTTVPEIIQRNTNIKVSAVTVSQPKKNRRKRARGI